MKSKTLIGTATALAVACGAWLCVNGQDTKPSSPTSAQTVTTNWVGYLVIGSDSIDMVGYGPDTGVALSVQVGLRSDGIMIWRKTPSGSGTNRKGGQELPNPVWRDVVIADEYIGDHWWWVFPLCFFLPYAIGFLIGMATTPNESKLSHGGGES